MKALEGKSKREKFLLLGLIVSLMFGAYLMTRVKSLNKELKQTESFIKDEKKKYNKLTRQTGNIKPSSAIRKEISSLEKKLNKEKQSLKGMDISFVDLSNQEALHTLIADITLAAEKNHLQVLSKVNEVSDLTQLVGSTELNHLNIQNNNSLRKANNKGKSINSNKITTKNEQALKRHVFKLQIRGSFLSTYQFINSLKGLKHAVLIARLKLQADDENTYNGRRLITTDLTLAI